MSSNRSNPSLCCVHEGKAYGIGVGVADVLAVGTKIFNSLFSGAAL